MAITLPHAFTSKMQQMLQEEFPAFMASYDEPRYYGLRINTLKISVQDFKERSPFSLQPIPWVETGFYYEEGARPGKHPYYHAGLYYIQEPSAMAPVELLDVRPGDRVLDLCAAPGGKSTQIAAKLQGEGILVTNDNHSDRTKALAKNIELSGVRNAVVLNEWPERIAKNFTHYFDKILIDAPCSGEGMFRKEEDMVKQWERHTVEQCMSMQADILEVVAKLLAPGGRIVYSTCTFSPEENECRIAAFLNEHPDFEVLPVTLPGGATGGRPDWTSLGGEEYTQMDDALLQQLSGTLRLWPHKVKGEGHYVAVLVHKAAPDEQKRSKGDLPKPRKELAPVYDFWQSHIRTEMNGKLIAYGEQIYLEPQGLPSLDGLKVVKPGWHIGTLRKERFAPSHALAMGLKLDEVHRTVSLSTEYAEAIRYLKGETLEMEDERVQRSENQSAKGFCLIGIDGFSVGWGKWVDGIMKNEYPAGWRWT